MLGDTMLVEVSIAKVATYGEQPQRLDGLRQINFLFGTNGSGKTTISRVIAEPTEHPSCAVNWRGARPLETLVYNSDFVDRNFAPQLRGIFTLGEVQTDTLEKIEAARAKVAEIEIQIGTLKTTLGAEDHSSGKRAELRDLRNAFEEQCWKIKTTHDPHFQGAFTGLRNSRTRFCDKVLEEADGNQAAVHSVEDLKARARTVQAESHHSQSINGPRRIPGDFPGMVVGVGHVAAEAPVRRCVSFPDHSSACFYQLLHDGDDVVLGGHIVGQRECTGHRKPRAAHILFKGRLAECAENETVHLVEDDLLILENRCPAKPLHIKPAGAGEIGDAKRDDGNLLLHIQVLCSLRTIA